MEIERKMYYYHSTTEMTKINMIMCKLFKDVQRNNIKVEECVKKFNPKVYFIIFTLFELPNTSKINIIFFIQFMIS